MTSDTDFREYAAPLRWSALAVTVALASGCSVMQEDTIDYRSAQPATTLEVPPDLTQLTRESRFVVPGGVATASAAAQVAAQPGVRAATAVSQLADVRIERAGAQRWLVVERPPEQLWGPVRNFWQENGFVLTMDQEKVGIMETDWAENRAKIPQDFIRATIGRLFDNLYSTGERDKFRTRMERTATGGTEIYISHRGMVESFSNERRDATVWQPRPSDLELEAEFLRRLMVKLGVTQEQAQAVLATGAAQPAARVLTLNNLPVVQMDEGFDRAWRRVGLALDRTGFTVEDRNRAEGVYFVRYAAPAAAPAREPGFLGRVFGGGQPAEVTPQRYRITVVSQGNQTTVSVLDANGQPDRSANAQRIVELIAADLK